MPKTFLSYLLEFDKKFESLDSIDRTFHHELLGVQSYASKANTRSSNGEFSEEYIRTRFVYALVYSGFYPKENLCIEFSIPKGNKAKALKPDIVAFKDPNWQSQYDEAKIAKNFNQIRQNLLVIFETKQNNKTLEEAIEYQLRPALAENESTERIFGVYFDNKHGVLLFKKIGNSPIRRLDEGIERTGSGLINLNYDKRDNYTDFPSHEDFLNNNRSISDVTKLTISALDAVDEVAFEEFLAELKRLADREGTKHSQRDLIVEFLTLKVYDEKRSRRDKTFLKFFIEPKEKTNEGLGTKSFRQRIQELYKDAQKEYKNVLSAPYFSYDSKLRPSNSNEERFLVALIESLQKRAILKAKNESFNQIIFNNFGDDKQKADKGQFFTPIPVVKTMIGMLNPIKGEELCDPCCGICDFPAMAFRHAHRNDEEFPPNASHYYGFDIEESNLKLAELNLVLNGDGGAMLKHMNSHSQKLLKNGEILKLGNFTTKYYDPETWSHKDDPEKDLKKFKIVATNPPFGKGRDLKTGAKGVWNVPKETINLYETYKIKSSPLANGKVNLPKSMDMGAIFLENAFKILEDGGRMAIVLSNSIASIKEWENVRKWLLERMRIVGVFDLPSNTFGETGVSTTVIIAYKPKKDEKKILNNNYEIFIKEVDNIGYEVKTVNRTVTFKPQFIINEETLEHTSELDEDFTEMQRNFKEFLKRQELAVKKAFNLGL